MSTLRLVAGRCAVVCAVVLLTLGFVNRGRAGETFPFDQQFVLDVKPMAPVKRVPVLTVGANSEARIDLWCRTGGRVELDDRAIRIEPAAPPDELPRYMSEGQCTSERMQADQEMLLLLAQVVEWRARGDSVVLSGPTTLRFRLSNH